MESDANVLSRRGETVTLGGEHVGDVHRHSAFSTWDDADHLPDGVDPATQVHVSGEPVPVHRDDLDDLARAEGEALVSLGGAVDHACLERLTAQVAAEPVAPGRLAEWLVEATVTVNDAAAPTCTVNAYLDTELRRYAGVTTQNGLSRRWLVDAGWCEADVQLMSRRQRPCHVVVADEHLAGLRGYLQVSMTSLDFGREEFLSASAVFGYSPRLGLHPGALRIARVEI
ncbi:hypothetical protein [Kineococcus sp. SYSU DK003]|uniref:hypothetical protein n=1 Tax=Kineococcus sp. SYSU DK003 TaxID=3383124 RepID=UPI003D7CF161